MVNRKWQCICPSQDVLDWLYAASCTWWSPSRYRFKIPLWWGFPPRCSSKGLAAKLNLRKERRGELPPSPFIWALHIWCPWISTRCRWSDKLLSDPNRSQTSSEHWHLPTSTSHIPLQSALFYQFSTHFILSWSSFCPLQPTPDETGSG